MPCRTLAYGDGFPCIAHFALMMLAYRAHGRLARCQTWALSALHLLADFSVAADERTAAVIRDLELRMCKVIAGFRRQFIATSLQ